MKTLNLEPARVFAGSRYYSQGPVKDKRTFTFNYMAITILILTPLPLEYAAVVSQMIGDLQTVFKDQAAYEVGQFIGKYHKYKVVMREPGMKNVDMALATERAIQAFHPHIVLLIGIAGGVKDVRIGDVLVAKSAYGYEAGKEDADGFKSRPTMESFSAELLARAQVASRHPHWKKRTSDGAPEAKVFLGPIAAGEKVVAGIDNPTFQRIKQHFNDALGLEMEAIGFAMALQNHPLVHSLVIRGISDLCAGKSETDQHNWQPVAAERAAAFAFELLYELDTSPFLIMDTKTLTKEIYSQLFPTPSAFQSLENDFDQASSKEVREIWNLVKPLLSREAEKLKSDPANTDRQASLRIKLEDELEDRLDLQKTLAVLLDDIKKSQKAAGKGINNSKNVIQNATITVSNGDFRIGDNN